MTLLSWIEARRPVVPEAFRRYVEPDDPARPGDTPEQRVDGLAAEAQSALERARARDTADREGAFDLLAADAWATWAAEAALDADDPVDALTRLARRLSDPTR